MAEIAKRKSSTVYVPDKETILKCINTATTVEAIEYFYMKTEQSVTMGGMAEKARNLLNSIKNILVSAQQREENKPNPWEIPTAQTAKQPLTSFQNKQREVAATAFKILGENIDILNNNIQFRYAINDSAQVLCGFPTLDNELAAINLDRLFVVWLAKNNIAVDGGMVYHIDNKGKILHDETGSEKKVSAEQFSALVEDPKTGFQQALMKKGIPIEIIKGDYNEFEAAVKAKPLELLSDESILENMDTEEEAPSSDSPAPSA